MPETSGGTPSAGSVASEATGLVPTQLAVLVPTFDPAKDDLTAYTKKVQLLTGMWPDGKWTELATRLILGCQGSAFFKLQLHQQEVTKNERKSVQRIIELLGGHWGQINLEKQYEHVERALFRCQQKQDESSDSFLARADIIWAELLSKGITLEDIQPYITLRGSLLGSDDKKRVLLDIDAAGTGKLSMDKVASSIRMLGAGFFHDVTGLKRNKGKTYDQTTLVAESQDVDDEPSATFHTESQDDVVDEELFETLIQEGDEEDASLVADFESAAADILQGDDDLASAYTAYVEARRRLNEKTRFRGFWPVSQSSKGKSKGHFKGKGRSFKGSSNRKTLQQRILESRCRICNRYGHWKAECPQRANQTDAGSSSRGSTAQAPTSFVSAQASDHPDVDGLPLEFLELPSHGTIMEKSKPEFSLVCFGDQGYGKGDSRTQLRRSIRYWDYCNQYQPSLHMIRSEASDVREPSFRKETMRARILLFSLEELETHTISFGKAHLGDTFQHVWDTDQKWVHWFISHYPTSSKTSHRFFRHFVEMKVERAELTGIRVPLTEPIVLPEPPASSVHGNTYPKAKGHPKAKAVAKSTAQPINDQVWQEVRDQAAEEYQWIHEEDMLNAMIEAPDVSHLETRMLNMENALSQVISQLERLTTLSPPSSQNVNQG